MNLPTPEDIANIVQLKADYSRAQAPRPTAVEVALVAVEIWKANTARNNEYVVRKARALIAEAEAQLSQEESDDD